MQTLINTKIVDFKVESYHNDGFKTVSQDDLKGKWSIIFFYPADFTFVCPTELGDMADKYSEFQKLGVEVKVGNIFTTDTFYHDNPVDWKRWADFGVLAVEMETVGLYTLAAKHGINALTILTVSDSLVTGEATSAEERQTTFTQMMNIALEMAE